MAAVTRKQLAMAILEMTKHIPNNKLALAVASYLIEQRRTHELDAVMREVIRLRAEHDNIAELNVTSANELSSKTISDIKQILGIQKAVVNNVIDKNVVGGVRVESNEVLLDLTVRNRLTKLRGVTNNT